MPSHLVELASEVLVKITGFCDVYDVLRLERVSSYSFPLILCCL